MGEDDIASKKKAQATGNLAETARNLASTSTGTSKQPAATAAEMTEKVLVKRDYERSTPYYEAVDHRKIPFIPVPGRGTDLDIIALCAYIASKALHDSGVSRALSVLMSNLLGGSLKPNLPDGGMTEAIQQHCTGRGEVIVASNTLLNTYNFNRLCSVAAFMCFRNGYYAPMQHSPRAPNVQAVSPGNWLLLSPALEVINGLASLPMADIQRTYVVRYVLPCVDDAVKAVIKLIERRNSKNYVKTMTENLSLIGKIVNAYNLSISDESKAILDEHSKFGVAIAVPTPAGTANGNFAAHCWTLFGDKKIVEACCSYMNVDAGSPDVPAVNVCDTPFNLLAL